VVVGGELVIGAVTTTREIRKSLDEKAKSK